MRVASSRSLGNDDTTLDRPPTRGNGDGRGGRHTTTARSRNRIVVTGVAVLVVAGVVIGILNPFASTRAPGIGISYSTTAVVRRSLSSQTQVNATLGYAGSYTVNLPSGTSSQGLSQAQQAVSNDESALATAQAGANAQADALSATAAQQQLGADQQTLASDQAALQSDQSVLQADENKQATDCSGGSAGSACSADQQRVGQDQQKVGQDQQAVSHDQIALAQAQQKQSQDATQIHNEITADQQKLADDQAALASAKEQATIPTAPFSELPHVGQVVSQDQTLYKLGSTPVVLLYGSTPATRNLFLGENGLDVAELNADLRTLGYSSAPDGDTFTDGTATAVSAFEAHVGVAQTGNLPLGQVVFLPTAARVTAVSAILGGMAQPGGAVLTATSTTRQVMIALDATLQASVKVGDPVTITLPNQSMTPGVVTYVGTVATTSSGSGGGGNSTPTIQVDVTPTDPAATGNLDQASVNVAITNATADDALVVPVNALLALANGGYALEVVPPHGRHYLVPVTTGLFDDADGLVQVTGPQLVAGMRVVVPSS